jgi:hypothetical protein
MMESETVINNKTCSEPNLIIYIHTVKHHTLGSANRTWPKNITYQTEQFISKNDNIIIVAEETYFVTVKKKNYLNTS